MLHQKQKKGAIVLAMDGESRRERQGCAAAAAKGEEKRPVVTRERSQTERWVAAASEMGRRVKRSGEGYLREAVRVRLGGFYMG
jgi:hypothetical protein